MSGTLTRNGRLWWAAASIVGTAFLWGTVLRAQDANPQQPGPPPGPAMRMGPGAIAASGDYVYVLKGNTVYQLKNADLSVVTQKDLPATNAPANNGAEKPPQ